jgi:hypothetical protein
MRFIVPILSGLVVAACAKPLEEREQKSRLANATAGVSDFAEVSYSIAVFIIVEHCVDSIFGHELTLP